MKNDLSYQNEISVIGSILLKPDMLVDVAGNVQAEDFTNEKARTAYGLILNQWQSKALVNVSTIMSAEPSLSTFLSESLTKASPFGAETASLISRTARARRIDSGLVHIQRHVATPDEKLGAILALYQQENRTGKQTTDIKSALKRFDQQVNNPSKRWSTGWSFLEEIFVRYRSGHLWVIGAATSVGKTATMVQLICNQFLLDSCPRMVIFSTEMTEGQLLARILAKYPQN